MFFYWLQVVHLEMMLFSYLKSTQPVLIKPSFCSYIAMTGMKLQTWGNTYISMNFVCAVLYGFPPTSFKARDGYCLTLSLFFVDPLRGKHSGILHNCYRQTSIRLARSGGLLPQPLRLHWWLAL